MNLEGIMLSKINQCKETNTVSFHLDEVSEVMKSIETGLGVQSSIQHKPDRCEALGLILGTKTII
jgi:hypothetical protein